MPKGKAVSILSLITTSTTKTDEAKDTRLARAEAFLELYGAYERLKNLLENESVKQMLAKMKADFESALDAEITQMTFLPRRKVALKMKQELLDSYKFDDLIVTNLKLLAVYYCKENTKKRKRYAQVLEAIFSSADEDGEFCKLLRLCADGLQKKLIDEFKCSVTKVAMSLVAYYSTQS